MDQTGTVEKAMEVLFHLHAEREPRGVSEIGRALALPKSSAHRLLRALSLRGLVEQDEAGRYRTGIGLLALGLGVLDREPLVAAARPVLEREARALGETCFLVTARAGQLLVVDKAESTGLLRASPQVGTVIPVHATAVGKLYLAHAPELVEPSRELTGFTQTTVRDPKKLSRAVAQARREGFARNHGEWIAGLTVLAAPILARDRLLGALAVAHAGEQPSQVDEHTLQVRLKAAAAEVGRRMLGESP